MSNGKKVRMRLMPYCRMFAEYMLDRFDKEAARGVKLGADESMVELLAVEFSIFFNRGREQENANWPGADVDGDPILRNKVLLTFAETYRRMCKRPRYHRGKVMPEETQTLREFFERRKSQSND